MQIELLGCTGAGKSTLARSLLEAWRAQGFDACTGDEFVLKQVGLDGVQARLARTLLVDLCSLMACLVSWQDYVDFYRFSIRIVVGLPPAVGWFEKLNLIRNVVKKIGVYEIIRRRAGQNLVVVDEGVLQTAHNLFVHVSVEPNMNDLSTLVRLVPMPDAAIYVRRMESVLIERLVKRGHKRVPGHSYTHAERFVKRAVLTFDNLVLRLVLEKKLAALGGHQNILVRPGLQTEPFVCTVLDIVCSRTDGVLADNSIGTMLDLGRRGGQAAADNRMP